MKRLLLFLMLAGLVVALSGSLQAGMDIVPNGSFEDNTDGSDLPDGWWTWSSGIWAGNSGEGHVYMENAPDAADGDDYMELTGGTYGWYAYYMIGQHDLDIRSYPPGTEYFMSIMAKKPAGGPDFSGKMRFEFFEQLRRQGKGWQPPRDAVEQAICDNDPRWPANVDFQVTSEEWVELTHTCIAPVAGDLSIFQGSDPAGTSNDRDGGYGNDGLPYHSTFDIDPQYVSVVVYVNGYGGPTSLHFDKFMAAGGSPPGGCSAHTPTPEDGKGIRASNITELSWANTTIDCAIEEHPTIDGIEIEVYFDTNEALVNEFDAGTLIKARQSSLGLSSISSSDPGIAAIMAAQPAGDDFYWRVRSFAMDGAVELGELGSSVWNFFTYNTLPTVDAGPSGTVWGGALPLQRKFTPSPTVTDDGMEYIEPVYTWTSNPPATSFTPDNHALAPLIKFPAASATYELTLTADDGNIDGNLVSDTTYVTVIYSAGGDTGLEVHLMLDETSGTVAADASGNGHVGTNVNGATIGGAGQVGTAYQLDAASEQYVEIEGSGYMTDPNISVWADFTASMTVSCWIKSSGTVASGSDDWAGLVAKDSGSWELQRDNNTSNVQLNIKGDVGIATSGDGLVLTNAFDGNWHHVVGTFNGNEINLYLDGLLAGTAEAGAALIPVGASNITIGRTVNNDDDPQDPPQNPSAWSSFFFFDGMIDNARIYNAGIPYRPVWGSPSVVDLYRADNGPPNCGGMYLASDFDQNCYTDLGDVVVLCNAWLNCNDVTNTICMPR